MSIISEVVLFFLAGVMWLFWYDCIIVFLLLDSRVSARLSYSTAKLDISLE